VESESTLAVHLAVWLYDRGHRVALVDADVQSSSSVWLQEAEPSVTVRNSRTPEEVVGRAP
jgi:cellulose biosynthesis protein BcsQ